ncbi:MAG: hypothetical protein OXG66_03065 [Acidimicrobiaceae bacterium]|nr:hypothetical protein [Acidimicrobiaceae bacterium]
MTIPLEQASSTSGHFRYDGATIRALCAAMSEERFATYLRMAKGDRRRALQLYAQNAALGSAFHGPLQALEVTLRNAVHDAMTVTGGVRWFESPQLDQPQQDAVTKAKGKLDNGMAPHKPGRIVAELSFGFWVALFARRYDESLWRTTLHQCFDPTPPRRPLHDELNRLLALRNRIAHHEPILQRNLRGYHDAILWVLGMLSPVMKHWVRHHSRVNEVLEQPTYRMVRF